MADPLEGLTRLDAAPDPGPQVFSRQYAAEMTDDDTAAGIVDVMRTQIAEGSTVTHYWDIVADGRREIGIVFA